MKSFLRPMLALTVVVGAAATASQVMAAEPYAIAPGDTLSIIVASAPDLDRDMAVGPDGTITVPLLGEIQAAGRTIAEIQSDIRDKISDSFYRQYSGGREEGPPLVIRGEEVAVVVDRYRPAYVDGAVADPGPINFQVGMTVRQAIASSGGIAVPDTLPREDVTSALAEVTTEYESTLLELASALAEMARAQAQLEGAETIDTALLDEIAVNPTFKQSLISLENAQLAADLKGQADEITFQEQALELARERIRNALDQTEAAAEAYAAEVDEVRRVQSLYNSSFYSADRLAQAKRTMMQTSGQLLNFRSEVSELREKERALVRDLTKAEVQRAATLYAKLRELSDKEQELRFAAQGLEAQKSALEQRQGIAVGAGQSVSSITVYRSVDGEMQEMTVRPDELLWPGDVVTVSL